MILSCRFLFRPCPVSRVEFVPVVYIYKKEKGAPPKSERVCKQHIAARQLVLAVPIHKLVQSLSHNSRVSIGLLLLLLPEVARVEGEILFFNSIGFLPPNSQVLLNHSHPRKPHKRLPHTHRICDGQEYQAVWGGDLCFPITGFQHTHTHRRRIGPHTKLACGFPPLSCYQVGAA